MVRAVVAAALRTAAKYNPETSDPPAAVFWPDPDRAWEPVIGLLQEAVPVLVLGDYDPARARGPAIWIRAALAAPDTVELPPHLAERDTRNPWVVYLPGFGRNALSDATGPDAEVAALVEVALRSTWWPSAHGQAPWTPRSFLGSKAGARLDIASDATTRAALADVLDRLLVEDVDQMRRMGRLDARRLYSLVMADGIRTLLEWMDDSDAARSSLGAAEWGAFVQECRSTYGFDPAKDGPIAAAARLGAREGAWQQVWDRFADNPRRHANLPALLDQARPQGDLFEGAGPHPDSWPSWNREQEDDLRAALAGLAGQHDTDQVRAEIHRLAAAHLRRDDSVWGALGQAPLARAVGHLADLAGAAAGPVGGNLEAQVAWYAEEGHRVDDSALRAIAAAPAAADREAVRLALAGLYDPWLEDTARAFQAAAAAGYGAEVGLDAPAGTCVVFVDALRFDLAQRLVRRLAPLETAVSPRLAAFPTVTPTGQPAVAPVPPGFGPGEGFDAGDAQGRSVKGQVFRAALAAVGVQYLDWKAAETGDVAGIGWTQTNTIDALGHDHDHALAGMLDPQLDLVAERIRGLLAAGWRRAVVVTDHGFLLPAAPALKVNLPLAVTEGDAARKPRVARLKAGAARPDFPIVPWTWDGTVDMVSAPGAAAFEAGALYEHGGLSPQECVIPVISVSAGAAAAAPTRIAGIRWTGQRCRIDFEPAEADIIAEVRLAPADPATRVGGPKPPSEPGEVKILVDEDQAAAGTAVHIVLLTADGAVTAQQQTTVGGSA